MHLCVGNKTKKTLFSNCFDKRVFFSDPAGARTQDPILKRDVLYLLSY